jgi:hypothetical protein
MNHAISLITNQLIGLPFSWLLIEQTTHWLDRKHKATIEILISIINVED